MASVFFESSGVVVQLSRCYLLSQSWYEIWIWESLTGHSFSSCQRTKSFNVSFLLLPLLNDSNTFVCCPCILNINTSTLVSCVLQEKESQCMFGLVLHCLDRLFHAVEGHAKATGEWQWLVSSPSFTFYPKSLAEVFPSFSLVQGKYEFGLKLIGNMFWTGWDRILLIWGSPAFKLTISSWCYLAWSGFTSACFLHWDDNRSIFCSPPQFNSFLPTKKRIKRK